MRPATAGEAAPMRIRPAAARTRPGRLVLWSLHAHALPLIGEDDAVFGDALDDDLAVERLALDELSSTEEHHAVPGIGRPHQHLELEFLDRLAELGADVRRRWRRYHGHDRRRCALRCSGCRAVPAWALGGLG